MERASEEPVPLLPPGTRVGSWRVKAWRGQGAFGAVFLAERVGWRRSERGALKVSLSVWNWRMAREVELLSRLSHPSIPRLLDRGGWRKPSAKEYPFFIMEWVEGPPLYAWAEQHSPSSQHLCRVLAHLARALQALHAEGAVHRDVKGANVLVRLSDWRAMLIDFGSCHFAGAQRMTWQSLPPVTPEYLSPQARLFLIRALHEPESYYPPSPADDLYALGVTAYRLVMGQYPPGIDARRDEQGTWQATGPDVRPLLESNPQVEPTLREVIVRLLSDAPEVRGTAAQVEQPRLRREIGQRHRWQRLPCQAFGSRKVTRAEVDEHRQPVGQPYQYVVPLHVAVHRALDMHRLQRSCQPRQHPAQLRSHRSVLLGPGI